MAADRDATPRSPDPTPDTAMATGSESEPGDRLGDGTLDPQERAVLDDLRHGGGDVAVTEAEEDSQAMADAVEDDTVVRDED